MFEEENRGGKWRRKIGKKVARTASTGQLPHIMPGRGECSKMKKPKEVGEKLEEKTGARSIERNFNAVLEIYTENSKLDVQIRVNAKRL